MLWKIRGGCLGQLHEITIVQHGLRYLDRERGLVCLDKHRPQRKCYKIVCEKPSEGGGQPINEAG